MSAGSSPSGGQRTPSRRSAQIATLAEQHATSGTGFLLLAHPPGTGKGFNAAIGLRQWMREVPTDDPRLADLLEQRREAELLQCALCGRPFDHPDVQITLLFSLPLPGLPPTLIVEAAQQPESNGGREAAVKARLCAAAQQLLDRGVRVDRRVRPCGRRPDQRGHDAQALATGRGMAAPGDAHAPAGSADAKGRHARCQADGAGAAWAGGAATSASPGRGDRATRRSGGCAGARDSGSGAESKTHGRRDPPSAAVPFPGNSPDSFRPYAPG